MGSDVTAEPAAWRVAGAVRSPLAPSILRLGRDSCFAGSGGLCSCIRPRYSDGKSQPLGLVPAAAKWLTDPPGEVCTADLAIVYRDWMQTVCERRYGFLVHEHREKAKRAAAAKRRPGEAKQQQLRQIEPKQPKAKPPQPMAKKARRQLASQRRKIAMGQPSQRTSRTAATSSYTTPNSAWHAARPPTARRTPSPSARSCQDGHRQAGCGGVIRLCQLGMRRSFMGPADRQPLDAALEVRSQVGRLARIGERGRAG